MLLEPQIFALFREELSAIPEFQNNYDRFALSRKKALEFEDFRVVAMYNPTRSISSTAKIDLKSIQNRPCFLCKKNRPPEQKGIAVLDRYEILVNPYPIFPHHFTIAEVTHTPQLLDHTRISDMVDIARLLPSFFVFYNGPKSGASAPDHFHFQAADRNILPVEADIRSKMETVADTPYFSIKSRDHYLRYILVLEAKDKEILKTKLGEIVHLMKKYVPSDPEPMLNLVVFYENGKWTIIIFPRKLHRPSQFFEEEEKKIIFSPGTVDSGGILIFPRECDFEQINKNLVRNMFEQVTIESGNFELLKIDIKNQLK